MHHINSSGCRGWIIHLLNKSHLLISGENSKVGICVFVREGGSRDGAGMRDNVSTNEEREALESEGQGLSVGSSFLPYACWHMINPL